MPSLVLRRIPSAPRRRAEVWAQQPVTVAATDTTTVVVVVVVLPSRAPPGSNTKQALAATAAAAALVRNRGRHRRSPLSPSFVRLEATHHYPPASGVVSASTQRPQRSG